MKTADMGGVNILVTYAFGGNLPDGEAHLN